MESKCVNLEIYKVRQNFYWLIAFVFFHLLLECFIERGTVFGVQQYAEDVGIIMIVAYLIGLIIIDSGMFTNISSKVLRISYVTLVITVMMIIFWAVTFILSSVFYSQF